MLKEKSKTYLERFIAQVKEFTKIIGEDFIIDCRDCNLNLSDYSIDLSFDIESFACEGLIYSRKLCPLLSDAYFENNVNIPFIDFMKNQEQYLSKYENLIINMLEEKGLSQQREFKKSKLTFILIFQETRETRATIYKVKDHYKKMHYLRLGSHLDYKVTRVYGIIDSFDKLYETFSNGYSLKISDFPNGELEYKRFFADYYTLIDNVIGINYKIKDLNNLSHFFSEVGGHLNQKQIEAPFVKIIKNKTMKKDSILLRCVNSIVSDLLYKPHINSSELNNLAESCNNNIKAFDKINIKNLESIIFNKDYFSSDYFKYSDPDSFRKLSESEINAFNYLIIYFLTIESAQEIYGVVKTSKFQLPTGEKGFFLKTNEHYGDEKLHLGISSELSNLAESCNSKAFNKINIKNLESIIFNQDYFSSYNFKYSNPDSFRKLLKPQINAFNHLIIYLLTIESAQEIYGVVKTSKFQLPTGEKGFFLKTNEHYSDEKLHLGIDLICKFMQNETIKKPFNSKSISKIGFDNYICDETLEAFKPYLLEVKIREAINANLNDKHKNLENEKFKI